MEGGTKDKITPRRELTKKLQGRQARSETDGSVFETQACGSGADMVWNEVTATQFTPRHEDALPTFVQEGHKRQPQEGPGLQEDLSAPTNMPNRGARCPEERGRSATASPLPAEGRKGSGAPKAPGRPASTSPRVTPPRNGSNPSKELGGGRAVQELNATVEELKESMERERERSKQLEKRAAEAEFIAVWLKEELDKSVQSTDLDGTRLVQRRAPAMEEDLDGTRKVQRARGAVGTATAWAGQGQEEDVDATRPVIRRAATGTGTAALEADGRGEARPPTRPQMDSCVQTVPQLGTSIDAGIPTAPQGVGTSGIPTAPQVIGNSGVPTAPQVQQEASPLGSRYRAMTLDEELDERAIGALQDPQRLREELLRARRFIDEKQQEVMSLEEENLVLQEELNREKQKVIELKRACNTHKEESQKASGDVEMNQWLQEEVALLRNETSKLREDLEQAQQREHILKTELGDLQQEAGKANNLHSQEMGRLSVTVGEQLVQVERELAQRTKELSEVTEPFLKYAHGLLGATRKACAQIDNATGRPRQPPPLLYDQRSRDLRENFRSILKLLKYMADVLALHTGMVNPYERGGTEYSASETGMSLVSSILEAPPEDASPQRGLHANHRGLQAPSDTGSQLTRERVKQLEQEPEVEVIRDDGWKRWTCYLQE